MHTHTGIVSGVSVSGYCDNTLVGAYWHRLSLQVPAAGAGESV